MPWKRPPKIDFEEDDTFRWPSWLVGLPMDDLFGDLHERFNTAPMFIQDAKSFHRDVAEIAYKASDKQQFYLMLQERKEERLKELIKMMSFVTSFLIGGHFHRHMNEDQRMSVMTLQAQGSFDSLIAFILGFLGPNKQGRPPNIDDHLSQDSLKKKYGHFLRQTPEDTPARTDQVARDDEGSAKRSRDVKDHSDDWEPDLDAEEQRYGWPKRWRRKSKTAESSRIDLEEEARPRKRPRFSTAHAGDAPQTAPMMDDQKEEVHGANFHYTYTEASTQTAAVILDTAESIKPCKPAKTSKRPEPKRPTKSRNPPPSMTSSRKTSKQGVGGLSERALRAQRRAEAKAR